MQLKFFYRLGLILTLSFVALGCEVPMETIYIEVPIETPVEVENGCKCKPMDGYECEPMNGCQCEPGGRCECQPTNGCECEPVEQSPEITGFTFTQVNPLRSAYAVSGAIIGRFSNPIGGIAPFTYSLVTGDGNNDTDNSRFIVSGESIKIHTGQLSPGMYRVYLGITDIKGVSYFQSVNITIAPDPIILDQVTCNVHDVNFKMRYVSSGTFIWYDSSSGMDTLEVVTNIPSGFWMAETEVTQELYETVMGNNPSLYKDSPAPGERQNQRPVGNVTFYEAILFCNNLSILSGREPVYQIWGVPQWETYLRWAISSKSSTAVSNIYINENANGYRLPSHDEWVWVAMGADIDKPGQINTSGVKKYYSGGPVGSSIGIDNYVWVHIYPDTWILHEVGKKQSNELGIYDMTGNSNEWAWGCVFVTSSGYSSIYSDIGRTNNPRACSHYTKENM